MIHIDWVREMEEDYDDLISRSVETALKEEGVQQEVEISVTIVNNEEIHEINKEQREVDAPTDVLSFPLIDFEGYDHAREGIEDTFPNPESGLVYLGDIVISWDKVLEQSNAYGHSVERELSFLTVHSVLHLLGFDHMEAEEESEMIDHQKTIMSVLGIAR